MVAPTSKTAVFSAVWAPGIAEGEGYASNVLDGEGALPDAGRRPFASSFLTP